MSWLGYLLLRLIHVLYSAFLELSSRWRCLDNRRPTPISASRTKTPSHLAIIFVIEEDDDHAREVCLDSVENAARWCREAGIQRLTVYDERGLLSSHAEELRLRLTPTPEPYGEQPSESEIEYPLTPPLSEHSHSRSLSPDYEHFQHNLHVVTLDLEPRRQVQRPRSKNVMKKRRNLTKQSGAITSPPLTLHIISRHSSKPAIASTAQHLRQLYLKNPDANLAKPEIVSLTVEQLNTLLEGTDGFKPPDLLIVHSISPPKRQRPSLELHGFPPWQSRLTELYQTKYVSDSRTNTLVVLNEKDFSAALDEFSGAEMRLGK